VSRFPGPAPDLPGFEYVEPLGTGGFADVYKYRQLGLGRQVAVKVLLTETEADVQASFAVEASVMAQLSNHPSIVSVYQAGTTAEGRPFLVMEFCPPPHLALRVRSRPLTASKALEVTVQLCGAVETAHRLGILHRDIKPANILFTEFGRPALTDFGISVTTVGGQSGEGIGMSVPWAPPEQLSVGAPMGPSGDVYSLAATLWTALVGRSPFHVQGGANDAMAMAARVRSTPVPPTRRPDVPESLERALRTAMAKSPSERYDSALAFARALQSIQAELHQPVTTIDVLDEHPVEVAAADDAGGTRVSGFVSIDPELPPARPTATPPAKAAAFLPAAPTSATPPSSTYTSPSLPYVAAPAEPDDGTALTFGRPVVPTPTVEVAEHVEAGKRPAPKGGIRAPVLAATLVVAAVAGVTIWLGTQSGDATDPSTPTTPNASPRDPFTAALTPPTHVDVTAGGSRRLHVSWAAVPAIRTYAVAPWDPSTRLDPAAARRVTGTQVVVGPTDLACVAVWTVRGTTRSNDPRVGCLHQ